MATIPIGIYPPYSIIWS